jgi:hypothetical protein
MRVVLAIAILGALLVPQKGQTRQGSVNPQSSVKSCAQITFTKPGIGGPYKGTVQNSDYNFTAILPSRLTAWSGVADEAPFHGFTLFLDAAGDSCILFEVHIRVDDEAVVRPPVGAKRVNIGKAIGWQNKASGIVNGTRFINATTTFSFVQPDQIDDGEITLVAPKSRSEEAMKTYDEFVQNLRFGN